MKQVGIVLELITLGFLLFLSSNKFSFAGDSHNFDTFNKSYANSYADSLNHILHTFKKTSSLLYTNDDQAFRVSRFSYNNEPVLYVEYSRSALLGITEKRYYLKDKNLVLFTENSIVTNTNRPYISTKAYFKNNALFLSEQRSAASRAGLTTARFQKTVLKNEGQFSDMARFEDAIDQEGEFNLVFQGIAEYPKAKYIILGRDNYSAYRAPIRVKAEDEFIRELCTNIYQYHGSKLDINWKPNGADEVYYCSGKLSKH